MSRRFSGVGVGIAATRLREISSGAPAADAELVDVEFAFVARELMHDERLAKYQRGRQRCMECLIVVVAGVLMLGFLLCIGVLMLSLMLHSTPF